MKIFNIPKEDLTSIDGKVFAVDTTSDGYHGITEGRYNFEIVGKDGDLFVYPIFWNGETFERVNDFVARTDKTKALYVGNTTIDPYNHPTLEELANVDSLTKEEQLVEAFKHFIHDYFSFTNVYTFLTGKLDLLPSPNVVKVESVSLDKKTANIFTGDSVTLKATILPKEATNKEVTFSTAESNLVSLDPVADECIVTGTEAGEARVTVTTVDGEFSDSCVVTIKQYIDITSVKVLGATEVDLGTTAQYSAKIEPENATDKSVVWSVSDSKIATIDQTGKLTPIKEGSVEVKATTSDSRTDSLTVIIKKVVEVESITIEGISDIKEGSNPSYQVTHLPAEAKAPEVTWSVDNHEAVSIDETGTLTMVNALNEEVTPVKVTATTNKGVVGTKDIKIYPIATGITFTPPKLELLEGESADFSYELIPSGSFDKDLTFVVDDESIIKLDSNNKTVHGVYNGNARVNVEDSGMVLGWLDVHVTVPELEEV